MIDSSKIDVEYVSEALSRLALRYFRNPDCRREFEAWYLARYGKPYEWKELTMTKGDL